MKCFEFHIKGLWSIHQFMLLNPGESTWHQLSMVRNWIKIFPKQKTNGTWISNSVGLSVRWDCVRVGISPAKLVTNLLLHQPGMYSTCNFPWKNSLDSPRMKIHWIQKWIENHISYIWWYVSTRQPHILFRNCQSCWGNPRNDEMDIHYYIYIMCICRYSHININLIYIQT